MSDNDQTSGDPSSHPNGNGRAPDDPVLDALRRWRTDNRAQYPALRDLKDAQLNTIAKTGSRTAEAVRRVVPKSVAVHAAEIADVVQEHQPDAAGGARPEEPPVPYGSSGGSGTGTGEPAPAAAAPDADADLAVLDLAGGDYAADPAGRTIGQELVRGTTVLRWEPFSSDAAVVIYRVVTADDDFRPTRPQDDPDPVRTRSTTWVDDRPCTSAVRHVQVWVHAGPTPQAAAAARPVLHAETQIVAWLQNPHLVLNGTSVVGRWPRPPGAESVLVLRVPRREVGSAGVHERRYLVNEEPNLTGFVDTGAEAAQDYVYLLYVKVTVKGKEMLSEAEMVPISVKAKLVPVPDLQVRLLRRKPPLGPVLDMTWTPPRHCDVRIYLTPEAPAAGATERPQPLAELERMRLPDRYLVPHPPHELGDGRMRVQGVEWPEGSAFAYATAVAELDGEVWVGRSVLQINLPPVSGAEIVERTHRQILVFDWPEGADNVLAYVGAPRQELDHVRGQQEPEQISRELYERQGGLHFKFPLPMGWDVHVMAQAYAANRSLLGPPCRLRYAGQHRLWYTLQPAGTAKNGGVAVATLQIVGDADERRADVPLFTLVHRPDRLPLHPQDGAPLDVLPAGTTRAMGGKFFRPEVLRAKPGQDMWNVVLGGLTGWVRLFVCPEPSRQTTYTLIDPPVRWLMLPAPPRGRP